MDTTSGKQIQCVVVTPEKALLDEPADFVALPMFDGELGVLPGRAPLIGRLGSGELRLQQRGATRRFFVDGGFAQVKADVVTVLTSRAMPAAEIDPQAARQQLAAAHAAVPRSPEEQEAKRRDEQRARAMLHVAQKSAGQETHG